MANVKITDLGAYTNPVSTDVLPIVDVGTDVTKKVSIADLLENAGSGTEALPGIAFDGDSNTGIYRPGPDQVAISTSGTGRLFVDSSGRVGIGETNPESLLHIKSSSGDAQIVLEHPGGANADKASITKVASDESLQLQASLGASNKSIVFLVGNNNEVARFDAGKELLIGTSTALSNVSISGGTTTPSVQIEGNSGSTSSLCITRTSNTGAANLMLQCGATATPVTADDKVGQINFSGFDGTNYRNTAQIASEVDGTPGTDDMPGRLIFSTTPSGSFSPTERMRIDSSGRLGLGTSNPDSLLDLRTAAGTNCTLLLNEATTTNPLKIEQTATEARIQTTASQPLILAGQSGVGSSSDIRLETRGDERLRITSDGKLGLGTSDPQADLAVEGNILAGTNIADGLVSAPNHLGTDVTAYVQVNSSGDGNPSISLNHARSNNLGSPCFLFNKAGGNLTTPTIVNSTTTLGTLVFNGYDGTNYINSALIEVDTDGTPGTDDMPGKITFSTTADGASSPDPRMTIKNDGKVGIGTTSPSELLQVDGGNLLVRDNSGNNITLSTNVGNGNDSTFIFQKARGGNSGPTQIVANDDLGAIQWNGYDGSSYNEAAKITCKANANTGDFDADLIYDSDEHVFRNGGSESARIDSSGRLLVGTSSESGGSLLQVNDDRIRIASSKTPASASDTGTAGEICWDSSYIYVCTATDTWKRAALSTW